MHQGTCRAPHPGHPPHTLPSNSRSPFFQSEAFHGIPRGEHQAATSRAVLVQHHNEPSGLWPPSPKSKTSQRIIPHKKLTKPPSHMCLCEHMYPPKRVFSLMVLIGWLVGTMVSPHMDDHQPHNPALAAQGLSRVQRHGCQVVDRGLREIQGLIKLLGGWSLWTTCRCPN